MRRLALAVLIASAAVPAFAAPPMDLAAAVAMKERPADQVALDASRRPVEVLRFLKLKRGDKVLDYAAGEGYYTEIVARYVGPKGGVTAYEANEFYISPEKKAAWEGLLKREPNAPAAASGRQVRRAREQLRLRAVPSYLS